MQQEETEKTVGESSSTQAAHRSDSPGVWLDLACQQRRRVPTAAQLATADVFVSEKPGRFIKDSVAVPVLQPRVGL